MQVGAGCWWFYCCCFPFLCLFPCAWVGPVDLLLRDLIVRSCRPVGGGPPYLIVNAGSLTIKKKKKKIFKSALKRDEYGSRPVTSIVPKWQSHK